MKVRITNDMYSKTSTIFNIACSIADIDPSTRQASKFRRKKGNAFKRITEARAVIKNIRVKTV